MEKSRVEMMRGYAEDAGCRRQFHLGYLGQQLAAPCGSCDNCIDQPERVPSSRPKKRTCPSR
jgi:ATP-dependent DNA helicase RecQ